jgi:hypothetical protein
VTLILEIALGIVLGALMLWVLIASGRVVLSISAIIVLFAAALGLLALIVLYPRFGLPAGILILVLVGVYAFTNDKKMNMDLMRAYGVPVTAGTYRRHMKTTFSEILVRDKAAHPELYCSVPTCHFRISSGKCVLHPDG